MARHRLYADTDDILYDDEDDIDAGSYAPVGLDRALDAIAVIGAESPNGAGMPVRGQRVAFKLRADGSGLLDAERQPLIRASDARVPFWQVTLAPVYLVMSGPSSASRPLKSGNPIVEMTWGGGGVSYRTSFDYPYAGASFVVSGDNIAMDVRANDGANVFTAAELTAVGAWASPRGAPTSVAPLVLDGLNYPGLYGPASVPTFARAIVIGLDDLAANALVAWRINGVNVATVRVSAGELRRLVPPPAATEVVVTASAGNVAVAWELAFT